VPRFTPHGVWVPEFSSSLCKSRIGGEEKRILETAAHCAAVSFKLVVLPFLVILALEEKDVNKDVNMVAGP
jgi:hypothetical protein